jgi:glucose-1-phosphate thymidylyltransferase
MKGIILAGGRGTRLFPLTHGVCKQLLPVYDKPMIYYPLATLMMAGIREILVISTPEAIPAFRTLLGDGKRWGLKFEYAEQDEPRGLADAFRVGSEFVGGEPVCLILGDNLFFGHGLPEQLTRAARAVEAEGGAIIFAYAVRDPERYGVVEFEDDGEGGEREGGFARAVSIVEKPKRPKSNYAVPGIYFYDGQAVEIAAGLQPSARDEIEITDLNNVYLKNGRLRVEVMGRGVAWLDAGTPEALLQAANFVQAVEDRQGLMIASPEEIAFRMGYIGRPELRRLARGLNNQYGEYLAGLVHGKH